MPGYNLFQTPTLGMRSQAHALNTIGINVANVNTGGYKRTDTEFETLISKTLQNESDLGGVVPKDYQRVDQQGFINSSSRELDLAINGDGFFYVSPTLTVSEEVYFTRDGSFQMSVLDGQTSDVTADDGSTITVSNGYLVDKNGYYVLGSAPDATTGLFSTTALQALRIDEWAFIDQDKESTTAYIQLNLDATKTASFAADQPDNFKFEIVDSSGAVRTVSLDFYKTFTENTWQIIPTADNATTISLTGSAFSNSAARVTYTSNTIQAKTTGDVPVLGAFAGLKAGDPITVADSTNNDGSYVINSVSADGSQLTLTTSTLTSGSETVATTLSSSQIVSTQMAFSGDGSLSSPTSYTLSATWSDGSTNAVTIDTSKLQQFAGAFLPLSYGHNGEASANMTGTQFDSSGHIVGTFQDGTQRTIYKLPLAQFQNADGLEMMNGMVFRETPESGTVSTVFADLSGRASFTPFARELSNVDIATEFTRMLMVQNAYNSSATVFKTVDEMVTVARDLKA